MNIHLRNFSKIIYYFSTIKRNKKWFHSIIISVYSVYVFKKELGYMISFFRESQQLLV